MKILSDLTVWSYLFIFIMSLFNACVYGYWLARNRGKASAWYIYVLLLFVALTILYSTAVYARILKFNGQEAYIAYMSSGLWVARTWLLLSVMAAITAHSIYRFWFKRVMVRKTVFDLKDPFTANQCMWLQDKLTSLMTWFAYEEKASAKLKDKMQAMLDEIKKNSVSCEIDETE